MMEHQPHESHSQSPKSFFDSGSPKLMFYFGVTLGVAASLLLNTVYSFAGGTVRLKPADKLAEVTAPTPAAAAPAGDEPAGAPVKGLQATDHLRGNKNAKVVMIEYSDFQCPYCGRHHPTLQKLMTDFPNQIAWVYRHFPLSFHPNAQPAAEASECASEQGKFWEFADAMFASQDSLSPTFYEKTATDLRLNLAKFKDCVATHKYASRISTDEQEGGVSGVNGTPATFINGQLVSGALPYDTIKQMVQSALN